MAARAEMIAFLTLWGHAIALCGCRRSGKERKPGLLGSRGGAIEPPREILDAGAVFAVVLERGALIVVTG